ncbi:MAG: transglycosylase SLT domain-containing protein [Bacteriovoracaceae bacterium]|nr:transglycosylase SLT domain-containing protein [Bacteriovoracaceae bacterium]
MNPIKGINISTKILVFLTSMLFIFQVYATSKVVRNPEFPVRGSIRIRVDFWKKVYTEITSKEAFIHDSENLKIIYGKAILKKGRRGRNNQIRKEKKRLRKILRSIAQKDYKNLTSEESKVSSIIGKRSKVDLYRMSRNIRFQYGLKDRYYKGLIRSYAYLEYIEKIFSDLKLPHELTYLPHVESSFNYEAYSKVGAAGIWQFMRSTARLYKMKVSYIVDERRDPIKATKAAARFLKDNYRMLKSWPLALTAYNHGPRSVKRAINKLKTTDINKIIENYKGRRFGFASKNFYATFMATVEISEDPRKYFPSFKKPAAYRFSSLKLDKAYTVEQLSRSLGLKTNTIKKLNPSIRRSVYRSSLYLPRGFSLRVPKSNHKEMKKFQLALASMKSKYKDADFSRMHIVSRGENIFDISRMYRTSMNNLIQFNQIVDPSRIYPGMKLKIPGKKDKVKPVLVAKVDNVKKNKTSISESRENLKRRTGSDKFLTKIKNVLIPKVKKTIDEKIALPDPKVSLGAYELEVVKVSRDVYSIKIETEETLGHFAEWAGVRTQKIRDVNRLSFGRVIGRGQSLKIPIPISKVEEFKQRRNEFHVSIQEDFYSSYSVIDKKIYKVKKGDNLSEILKDQNLPFWLIRKYQNKKLGDFLRIGQEIVIPEVEETENEEA